MRYILLILVTLPLSIPALVFIYSLFGLWPFWVAGVLAIGVVVEHFTKAKETEEKPVAMEQVTFIERRKTTCDETGEEIWTTNKTVTHRPQSDMYKGESAGES